MRFKIFFEMSENNMVEKAFEFAKEKHRGQIRKGHGLPYIVHPEMVMELVKKFIPNYTDTMLMAGLLHDVMEDCNVTYNELKEKFGVEVADLVLELTSNDNDIKPIGKTNYLIKKMNLMSETALTIKLLDRLHNVVDMPVGKWSDSYSDQTKNIIANLNTVNNTQRKIINQINIAIEKKT